MLAQVGQRLPNLLQHLPIQGAVASFRIGKRGIGFEFLQLLPQLFEDFLRGKTGAGRTQVAIQGVSTPAGLDEQHLLVEMVPDDVAKFEFRAKAVSLLTKADGQVSFSLEVLDPYIF